MTDLGKHLRLVYQLTQMLTYVSPQTSTVEENWGTTLATLNHPTILETTQLMWNASGI